MDCSSEIFQIAIQVQNLGVLQLLIMCIGKAVEQKKGVNFDTDQFGILMIDKCFQMGMAIQKYLSDLYFL